MKDVFRYTLCPVILGATPHARLLADRFWRCFRVRSYVMSDRYHPALLLAPTLRFRKLCRQNSYADLILADLIRLSDEQRDKLSVLIATTPYYRQFLREHQDTLEPYYILSDPSLDFLTKTLPETRTHLMRGEQA